MGGQLIKGYALEGDSQGQVGLNKAWKLYRGHKAQTHSLASIFLIQKKQLKKAEREDTIKIAKKEASSLLRVRHPGVLAVVQPLTEDENILAFVTERVEGTMSQLIKNTKMSEYLSSELELKLYLYPFLEAISFIHDTLKQAHLAISPDHVYITPEGKWKLAGFGVNQQLTGEEKQTTEQKFYDYSYSAPELALSNTFHKRTDLFSVGVFIVKVLEFINKQQRPLAILDRNQYEKYSGELKKLLNSPVIAKSSHSADLQELLNGLLNWECDKRLTVDEVLSSRWMNDSTLITVKYLDKINNYENKQQLQFLKGLAGVLDDFDVRVLSRIILPKLIDLLKFGHLIASVTFIIIDLLKKGRLTNGLFNKLVWPALKAIMQGKEMTAQAIYLFVLNYEVLEKFVGEADSNTYLLPLYIKCYDCPPKLKQLALRSLERLSRKLDYQNFKTRVIPKLLGLFKDPSIDIRKDALRGLYGILKVIDAQTMSISVLPAIQIARKSGSDPFVNAIINAIYNTLCSSLSSDVLCNKILPTLIPYLSEPSITKSQFYQFKSTIMNMIGIIQKEREKSFVNNVAMEEGQFTDADFRFKEEEAKNQPESKGNYSFLANYIEVKPDPTANLSNSAVQQTSNTPVPAINNPLAAQNPISASFTQPVLNYSIPTHPVVQPKVQTHPQPRREPPELKSSNVPIQPIEIKPTSTINFPIKVQFPDQQPTQPISFDFSSLGSYQPLDLNFTDSNQSPILSFNAPAVPTKEEEKKVEQVIKPLKIGPVLQSKDSKDSKDSPVAEKKAKFIGGASGPMEIKKIVGPAQKLKPPPVKEQPKPQSSALDMNFFSNAPSSKPESNNFSMQFTGYNNFEMKFTQQQPSSSLIKPAAKMPEQTLKPQIQSFSFQAPPLMAGLKLEPSDPNNPFAEIQTGLGPSAKSDIFSYFQEQKKPQGGNSMDLI